MKSTPEELTACYENKSSSEQLKLEVNIKKYIFDRGYMPCYMISSMETASLPFFVK